MAAHFCAAIIFNYFSCYQAVNFVNLKSRTKVTGAFERPETVYEMVQVSAESALTTPWFSTRHDLGVNDSADHLDTREFGTLMYERYGEVVSASNLDIRFFMFEASWAYIT